VLSELPEAGVGYPLPAGWRRILWAVATFDVMAVAWMLSAGDVLDRSRLTSVITLGGHHLVVLYLAMVGFAALAGLAALTGGFAVASRQQAIGISVAAAVSVLALAGVLSVVVLVVGSLLLIAVVGRMLLR
jgi:hypothetical protein